MSSTLNLRDALFQKRFGARGGRFMGRFQKHEERLIIGSVTFLLPGALLLHWSLSHFKGAENAFWIGVMCGALLGAGLFSSLNSAQASRDPCILRAGFKPLKSTDFLAFFIIFDLDKGFILYYNLVFYGLRVSMSRDPLNALFESQQEDRKLLIERKEGPHARLD